MIFLLLSCNNDALVPNPVRIWSYEEFVGACGATWSQTTPLIPDGHIGSVDLSCSASVGSILGFDWSSFQEEARAFDGGDTNAELVIEGFLGATGPTGITISSLLTDEAPINLREALLTVQQDYGVEGSDDASVLWFYFIRDSIHSVSYDPTQTTIMSYQNGHLFVSDIARIEPTTPPGPQKPPIHIADVLVHEAAHNIYDQHIACSEDVESLECDATEEGAYGAGIWWLYLMLKRWEHEGFSAETCSAVTELIRGYCDRLLEPSAFSACDDEVLAQACQ